jgi:hypothetical protein
VKPKEIVEAWVEAFNRADVEALASLYSELIQFQRGYWDKLSFLRMHKLPLPSK